MLYNSLNFISYLTHLVPIVGVPLYLYQKNGKSTTKYLLSLILVLSITFFLKYFFHIPRPENALVEVMSPRFPSGHTAVSFLMVGYFKNRRYRVLFLIYALLVSYSRIYFGVHKYIDLFVGAMIGFFVPLLISYFKNGYFSLNIR